MCAIRLDFPEIRFLGEFLPESRELVLLVILEKLGIFRIIWRKLDIWNPGIPQRFH